jgi:hypothetical protein
MANFLFLSLEYNFFLKFQLKRKLIICFHIFSPFLFSSSISCLPLFPLYRTSKCDCWMQVACKFALSAEEVLLLIDDTSFFLQTKKERSCLSLPFKFPTTQLSRLIEIYSNLNHHKTFSVSILRYRFSTSLNDARISHLGFFHYLRKIKSVDSTFQASLNDKIVN